MNMSSLLDYELEDIDEIMERAEDIQEAEGGRFRIDSLDSANWAFRKLAAIERKEREITQLANAERQRIAEWEDKEIKQLKNSKDFFNFLLEEYYREQRELDPKFKLSTPYGKVISRKQQPKWNYEEDRLLGWLKANDLTLVRIKEEVNKSELKKKYKIVGSNVVTEDGEIVEGITIEERDPIITIKVVE